MKIEKLHLQDFGQFHDKDITLAPGVNILYGSNEAGKTTTKDFIVDMLYGMDADTGARLDQYEKRKPINGDAYTGAMEVATESGEYLVERNFLKTEKQTVVKDLNSGYEVPLQEPGNLVGTLLHTDKSTYMNTLCIGQTELATNHAIVDKLNDYIVNMASTRAGDVDAVNAITQLNEKKKEFANEPLEAREQELTAKLQLDRDYDAEIAAVEEEYRKVEASAGDEKEAKLQFTPIKNASMRDEEEVEDEESEDTEEPEEELTEREKDMKMLQNMGKRSVLDNAFVLLFCSLLFIALFVGIAWIIPVNIPQLKMGIMGFGILLVVITTIQVFSRRAKLYRLLEEMEIEQGFEDAKAEVAIAQSEDQTERNIRLSELRDKKNDIIKERKEQEDMLVEINQLKEKMASNNVELAALDLAIRTIQDLSEEIYDSFGSVLNDQVSALVRKITNGKYSEVRIDDQLRVMVKSGNSYIGMDYLSTGTIEQIYLALRLSIANVLIAEDLPIIIDDIFVTYDYQRLYDTVSCLGEYLNRQIIMFTTNPGLQEMCTQLGIAYNAISL
ncbi:MAG: AAA family ATPase [Lachnospiraceae bacterium]|nr:AAA family ATPase [Lachnospiraceae bacterium]